MSESGELFELDSWSDGGPESVSSSSLDLGSVGGIGSQGCVRNILGGARLRSVAALALTSRLVLHSLSLLLRLERSERSEALDGGGTGTKLLLLS